MPTRAELRSAVEDRSGDRIAALTRLAAFDRERHEEDSRLHAAQIENLVRIHNAMARLRVCETAAHLIAAAPRELVDSCGFTRAMISSVEGSLWVPQALEARDGADPELESFRAFVDAAEIPLEHMLLETELVRRRVAVLVTDVASDPRLHSTVVAASRATSFVAAPIVQGMRVIGMVHADRYGDSDPVTASDLDLLQTFAEHFGLLFERAVLVERLVEQRTKLADALALASDGIDDLYTHELELVRGSPAAPASAERRRESRIEALLTAREREILGLLSTGATNAVVARQLVISEATIKSHLKRIHRKLHVNTRAEVIAKFLHLLRLDEERGA